jgi:hypothetical protein
MLLRVGSSTRNLIHTRQQPAAQVEEKQEAKQQMSANAGHVTHLRVGSDKRNLLHTRQQPAAQEKDGKTQDVSSVACQSRQLRVRSSTRSLLHTRQQPAANGGETAACQQMLATSCSSGPAAARRTFSTAGSSLHNGKIQDVSSVAHAPEQTTQMQLPKVFLI